VTAKHWCGLEASVRADFRHIAGVAEQTDKETLREAVSRLKNVNLPEEVRLKLRAAVELIKQCCKGEKKDPCSDEWLLDPALGIADMYLPVALMKWYHGTVRDVRTLLKDLTTLNDADFKRFQTLQRGALFLQRRV
jgi:hypothetical protein